jgi:hypothetical protein
MILRILLIILGIIFIVFIESFFGAIFNFKIVIILFFFLFKKVDWKILFALSFVILLVLDVVNRFPLGTNVLIISIPLAVLMLSSLFFSIEYGPSAFFLRILTFLIYYVLYIVAPNFFLSAKFGYITINEFLYSLLKAVFSTFLLILLEYILAEFRDRGNATQIRLK